MVGDTYADTSNKKEMVKNIGLLDESGNPTGKKACIILRNGYGNNRPEVTVLVTLKIGTGYPEWGAEEDEWYYVLEILGKTERPIE